MQTSGLMLLNILILLSTESAPFSILRSNTYPDKPWDTLDAIPVYDSRHFHQRLPSLVLLDVRPIASMKRDHSPAGKVLHLLREKRDYTLKGLQGLANISWREPAVYWEACFSECWVWEWGLGGEWEMSWLYFRILCILSALASGSLILKRLLLPGLLIPRESKCLPCKCASHMHTNPS